MVDIALTLREELMLSYCVYVIMLPDEWGYYISAVWKEWMLYILEMLNVYVVQTVNSAIGKSVKLNDGNTLCYFWTLFLVLLLGSL